MPIKIDLIGKRFGRLVVIEEAERKNRKLRWKCKCDCNSYVYVIGYSLRDGRTKSCGCFSIELVKKRNITHGMSPRTGQHPIYMAYTGLMQRCYNTNNDRYKNYGGRGITVCDLWRESFENFLADMQKNWEKGLTIDRIDNDGNYEPSNCRWATKQIQNQNQSNTKLNPEIVREIRAFHKDNPHISKVEISKMYGVSGRHIGHIVNYQTWKNV